jgi:putative flippase GtrA
MIAHTAASPDLPATLPTNLTTALLRMLARVPVVGRAAVLLDCVYLYLWSLRPELVQKLSNFLPIGLFCTVTQASLLFTLKHEGVSTAIATVAAITASIFINYLANQRITWRDRFYLLSRRQYMLWFVPLFFIFIVFTPTIYLKTIGIVALERRYSVPILLSWPVFELVGVAANFIGADKISFGAVIRCLQHIDVHDRDRGKRYVE